MIKTIALNPREEKVDISTEEKMDIARYKCSIFHYVSVMDEFIYHDFKAYHKSIAGKKPSFAFLRPDDGLVVGVVYVFKSRTSLKIFESENKHLVKLRERTLKQNIYED